MSVSLDGCCCGSVAHLVTKWCYLQIWSPALPVFLGLLILTSSVCIEVVSASVRVKSVKSQNQRSDPKYTWVRWKWQESPFLWYSLLQTNVCLRIKLVQNKKPQFYNFVFGKFLSTADIFWRWKTEDDFDFIWKPKILASKMVFGSSRKPRTYSRIS